MKPLLDPIQFACMAVGAMVIALALFIVLANVIRAGWRWFRYRRLIWRAFLAGK